MHYASITSCHTNAFYSNEQPWRDAARRQMNPLHDPVVHGDLDRAVDAGNIEMSALGYVFEIEQNLSAVRHNIENGESAESEKSSFSVVFSSRPANAGIPDGIIRERGKPVPLPEATITDLVMFEAVKGLPFSRGISLYYHSLEAIELHLKKMKRMKYRGRDAAHGGLHRFSEIKGASAYWLDDAHRLMRVAWDRDKVFTRSSREEAETVFQ